VEEEDGVEGVESATRVVELLEEDEDDEVVIVGDVCIVVVILPEVELVLEPEDTAGKLFFIVRAVGVGEVGGELVAAFLGSLSTVSNQSKPSVRPSPFNAEHSIKVHWRFFKKSFNSNFSTK